MRKDPTQFRERYKRWKSGEQVYSAGLPYPLRTSRDYDDARAYELGYEPGEDGHMPSRDYKTGRYLKSAGHPTESLAVYTDLGMGYDVYRKNGHTYSNPNWSSTFKDRMPTYDDGKMPNDSALARANRVYTNYDDAIDFNMPMPVYAARKLLYDFGIKSGLSNCTLTATQWVDPNNPIKSANTIVTNPAKYGYEQITQDDVIPGNLMISRNPETGSYHTMMVESINPDGSPNLRYSTGGPKSDSLRTGISQDEYHRRDNEQGGNHTVDMFFRYNYPNLTYLPEVVINAPKKYRKK